MSPAAYDKHYAEPRLFREPLPALAHFFEELLPRRTVWDLGAGQGRDSLLLAQIGHRVLAIDQSQVGLTQLRAQATALLGGRIQTRVDDLHQVPIESECEVILLDAMFHFYKRDAAREEALLTRLSVELRPLGILALAIVKNARTNTALAKLKATLWPDWTRLAEVVSKHESSSTNYYFLALQKPDR